MNMTEEPLRECLSLGEYIELARYHLINGHYQELMELFDEMQYGEWVLDCTTPSDQKKSP